MLKRISTHLSSLVKKTVKMATSIDLTKTTGDKRSGENDDTQEPSAKKSKQEVDVPGPMQGRTDRKRKVALLLSYCGKGYYGLQRNEGFDTVEGELMKALLKCELIPQEHYDSPQKMSFQRAARTDKGVSAVANVMSLKMLLDKENILENINKNLPPGIRVMGVRRTTKTFNSKNFCCKRTYAYLTPTYAFAPVEKFVTEEYRTTQEIISEVNRILGLYKGTHNFHNFTSGIKPDDPSAKRYILSFECGEPFVRDGIEFALMRVTGQSFMMHHIRKMVGLMIAIVKGYCGEEALVKAWEKEKVDVPKAPGVGLMLEQLYYDAYNRRFGNDGMHEPIDWSHLQEKLEKFREEQIISEMLRSEKEEKVMLKWLGTLHLHKFDMVEEAGFDSWKMMRMVKAQNKAKEQVKAASDDNGDEAVSDDDGAGPGEQHDCRPDDVGAKSMRVNVVDDVSLADDCCENTEVEKDINIKLDSEKEQASSKA